MTDDIESRLRSQLSQVADLLQDPSGADESKEHRPRPLGPRLAAATVAVVALIGVVAAVNTARTGDPTVRADAPRDAGDRVDGETATPAAGGLAEPPVGAPTSPSAGGGTTADTAPDNSAWVRILIYSGRPNPRWELTSDQRSELLTMIDALEVDELTEPPPGRLGFSGFAIEDLGSSKYDGPFTVSGPTVVCLCGDDEASTIVLGDPDQTVERRLVEWSSQQPLEPEVLAELSGSR
jgi:hypothetical protein